VSAHVSHFSLWDSIEYGAGWLLDKRVSPPRCRDPRPDWVSDVTFLDDKNAPLRWCAGHDADHAEELQVKLAVNRSYAVGAQALAVPAVTRASVFGGGPSELLNGLAGRAVDAALAPFARSFGAKIPVMGGQEIAFSFTRDQVEQRQGGALIHVSPDAPDAAAGLVFWAIQNAGERGMLGSAGAYLTAYAAIGQCEAGVLRPFERGDWAEGLSGLVGCLTSNRDTTTKLVSRALVKQFPDKDPRELGQLAAKLGSGLRYVAIAGAGFKVATWFTDRRLPAAAFEAHAFVVPTLRIQGSDSFGGMPNPGTLRQAIARFGRPSSMQDDGSGVDCFVRWDALGIRALFQDFGATDSASCLPADAFTLSEASLTGSRWMTSTGVRIGDPLGQLRAAYPDAAHPADCVTDHVPDSSWWRLLRTPDPLGGPGSFICTLAAIVRDGRVAQFELSSSAASE
jgi:hypothetical protein